MSKNDQFEEIRSTAEAKILQAYPEATDIQQKGRHALYFSFINQGQRGSYTPKQDRVSEHLVWPTPEMGTFPTVPSSEFLATLENKDPDAE